jgi:hypothetical protein
LPSDQAAARAVEDIMQRQLLSICLLLLVLLPQAAWAQAAIGPGQEVADLNDYINAHEDNAALGSDVAKAMQRLGRLEEEQKHVEAATALWKRAKAWFARHRYAQNGGPEAALAAEATRRLLAVPVAVATDLQVRTTPQQAPQAAIAERAAELDGFLTLYIGKRASASAEAVRQGGLFAELDAVRAYGALAETRMAAQTIAKLEERAAGHLAQLPIPEGLDAAQQTAQQLAVKQAIGELEGRAFTAIEAAWLAKPDEKSAEALALRKHLTRLRPLKYAQLESSATDMVAVTDAQAEASKNASLAQKTEILVLKVKFLEKAVKLDPQNAQYLTLLQEAKAKLAASKAANP